MELLPELSYLQPRLYPDLVRVGSFHDGGYVIPKSALAEIQAVLSFGVSVDWNFERQLRAMRPGIDIHCYDHTVGPRLFAKVAVRSFVDLLSGRGSLANVRARLGLWRDYGRFFRDRTVHFRERVFTRREHANDATIDSIFARVPGKRPVLIKVDIEGGEYGVIPDLLRHADVVDVLVVEFHDTNQLRVLFEQRVEELRRHFVVAHVHANNYGGRGVGGLPDFLEMTFVSKRLGVPAERRSRLPIAELDSPCNPASAELGLQFSGS